MQILCCFSSIDSVSSKIRRDRQLFEKKLVKVLLVKANLCLCSDILKSLSSNKNKGRVLKKRLRQPFLCHIDIALEVGTLAIRKSFSCETRKCQASFYSRGTCWDTFIHSVHNKEEPYMQAVRSALSDFLTMLVLKVISRILMAKLWSMERSIGLSELNSKIIST